MGKKIGIPFTDYDDREKEFSIMSKGLGIRYVEKTGNFHKTQIEAYTMLNGIKYKLPRYYKDKVLPVLSPNQKKALLNKLLTNKITTDEYNEKITTSATNKAIRFKMATFAKAKYIEAEERFIDSFNSIEDMTTISTLHYRTLKKSEISLKEYLITKEKIHLERIKDNLKCRTSSYLS